MTLGARWSLQCLMREAALANAPLPHDLEALAWNSVKMPFAAVKMIEAMGVPRRTIAQWALAADWAVAGVDLSADGQSWTWGGPTRRLLLGVRDEFGELVDIVAIASHVRDEWALLSGDGWALGLDQLAEAEQARDEAVTMAWKTKVRQTTLRIHATPIDWLIHGGSGICVLDWAHYETLPRLRQLGEHVTLAVDPAGRSKLQAMLAHGGLPRVVSAAAELGAAA